MFYLYYKVKFELNIFGESNEFKRIKSAVKVKEEK